jgi:hypothetical protein
MVWLLHLASTSLKFIQKGQKETLLLQGKRSESLKFRAK